LISALLTSMQQAICEYQGSAGVWIWANLVSLCCVMVHLLWKHVKHLAILSAENRCCLATCSLRPTRSPWAQRVPLPAHAAPQTVHSCKAQVSGPDPGTRSLRSGKDEPSAQSHCACVISISVDLGWQSSGCTLPPMKRSLKHRWWATHRRWAMVTCQR